MRFIVKYERARVEFDTYEVEIEAENAFEADLKVRDTASTTLQGWVDKPKLIECDRRLGPSTRRVMGVKAKT